VYLVQENNIQMRVVRVVEVVRVVKVVRARSVARVAKVAKVVKDSRLLVKGRRIDPSHLQSGTLVLKERQSPLNSSPPLATLSSPASLP